MTNIKRALFVSLLLSFLWTQESIASTAIEIEIEDSSPYHVYKAGKPFSIDIDVDAPDNAKIYYHWADETGKPLTERQEVSESGTITSPSTQAGYYGLVFSSPSQDIALPDREPGEPREYGFVVLPELQKLALSSRFGTIHTDINDPAMPPWAKTTTWLTFPSSAWGKAMRNVRHNGKIELPIIFQDAWESDDTRPMAEGELVQLEETAFDYFSASPETLFWEAGLEENLRPVYFQPYYWENLEKKFVRLRAAANKAGLPIKFLYQAVGVDPYAIDQFFSHRAYRYVDILSLHPYAWPDFPSPDMWMDGYMAYVKKLKAEHGTNIPVWFTEVGGPQFGNRDGGFFGYPEENKKTGGLSPLQASIFMTKLCTLALSQGVERIFWYNYRDGTPARNYVESHFGMRDYWGFPKPVYATYVTLSQRLEGFERVHPLTQLSPSLRAFAFDKQNGLRTYVLWNKDQEQQKLQLHSLLGKGETIERITDMTGRDVSPTEGSVALTDRPVLIDTRLTP